MAYGEALLKISAYHKKSAHQKSGYYKNIQQVFFKLHARLPIYIIHYRIYSETLFTLHT